MQPAPAETALLEIKLFGTAEVMVRGEPLRTLHTRRSLWLLAILALKAGSSCDRSVLAGLLWPDSPQTTALHNLRQALADLRHALGPAAALIVAASPRSIRLDVRRAIIDVLDFDRASADNGLDSLCNAAGLYRGQLLVDCGEPWACEERRARAEAYLKVLDLLATQCRSEGDNAGRIGWLRLAAAAEPYRETIHRELISALAESGELAAASGVYHSLRTRLHHDLNAKPDPQTTEVYARIHKQSTAQSVPTRVSDRAIVPRSLPAPRTKLIGREDSLRYLSELLTNARLVTLTGTGGIGKTRLAIQAAVKLTSRFDGRVAFVELAPLADATTLKDAVRVALGIPADSRISDPAESIVRHVSAAPYLIVLDNCEHIMAACAEFAEHVLDRCAGLTILATSRHALRITGETIWRVPPLAVRRAGGSGTDVTQCAAVDMFVQRAQAVDSAFRLTDATVAEIEAICRQLDGIPLAIELAAARVRALSVSQIHARLTTGLELLSKGGPAVLPRHQTLDAAFEWSWDLLDADERFVLRRLSVFAGGCSLEAAEAVCSDDNITKEKVADLLTSLVDKSLVVYGGVDFGADESLSGHEARYRLLETVRQYAAGRLGTSGEEARIRNRHLDHYLTLAESIRPQLFQSEQRLWFSRVEADHDNYRAALAWCRSNPTGVTTELRMVCALSRFWDTHGHIHEGLGHLQAALERALREEDSELLANVLSQAGWAAATLGQRLAARSHYERSIAIWRKLGKETHVAGVLNSLGVMLVESEEYSEARVVLEETLRIRRAEQSGWIGPALSNMGELELKLGNPAAARSYFFESVQFCEKRGRPHQAGIALCNLSAVDLHEGMLVRARAYGIAALNALNGCGAIVDVPRVLDTLALVAWREQDFARTAKLFGAADAIRSSLGVPHPLSSEKGLALEAIRTQLGLNLFQERFEEGMAMTPEQAAEFGLCSIART